MKSIRRRMKFWRWAASYKYILRQQEMKYAYNQW